MGRDLRSLKTRGRAHPSLRLGSGSTEEPHRALSSTNQSGALGRGTTSPSMHHAAVRGRQAAPQRSLRTGGELRPGRAATPEVPRRRRWALGPDGHGSGYGGGVAGRTGWGPVAGGPEVRGAQRQAAAPRRVFRPHAREDSADHGCEQRPGPRHSRRAAALGGPSDHGLPGPHTRRGGGGSAPP